VVVFIACLRDRCSGDLALKQAIKLPQIQALKTSLHLDLKQAIKATSNTGT
jgi:hypothetical protein